MKFPNLHVKAPIRYKIVALIALALAASFASYLYLGTSLVTQDKTTYLYDFALNQLQAASQPIDYRITNVVGAARALGSGAQAAPDADPAERLYAEISRSHSIRGIALLRWPPGGPISPARVFGESGAVTGLLGELGWTPAALSQGGVLIAGVGEDGIAIGAGAANEEGGAGFAALARLDEKLLESSGDLAIFVLDPAGRIVLSRNAAAHAGLEQGEALKFHQAIESSQFDTGVREWGSGEKPFLAAYRRFAFGKLTIAGFVPKEIALTAARELTKKSILAGLGVLLAAIGLTLLLARGITVRIRRLSEATGRVREGDFTVRVDTEHGSRDEIFDLSASFNSMAAKITDLLEETREKARMENELRTAQLVQNRFFPKAPFNHASFRLSGRIQPASECGGDWWQYVHVGDHVLILIGDVTGHGASAALVTAAVHGTFSVAANECRTTGMKPSLPVILGWLNEAVVASGGGNTTMTVTACLLDLKTGRMEVVNAGHIPPMVYRVTGASGARPPMERFKPLFDTPVPALGHAADLQLAMTVFQLEPGDRLFWCTDGLFECTNAEGKTLSQRLFSDTFARIDERSNAAAERICDDLLTEALNFFGAGALSLADDITVVVGVVPENARFETASEGRSSRAGAAAASAASLTSSKGT